MKFGKIDNPSEVDFTLPEDHLETSEILSKSTSNKLNEVYVGCAKWNRQELKNFYPRGTKDELSYYSTQFNSIELNASFYRIFPPEQFEKWKNKTPEGFKFFPKITNSISHIRRLQSVERLVDEYIHSITRLEEKLGMVFLQLHENFAPKDFDRIVRFVEYWPKGIPLTVELRHSDWYNDPQVLEDLYALLKTNHITSTLVDTAGRRDLLHMRLSTPTAFVRYVGANHPSDYRRLDDWVLRLKKWVDNGLENIFFFVHQNLEQESPLLARYFIEKLNAHLKTSLKLPETILKKAPPKGLFDQ